MILRRSKDEALRGKAELHRIVFLSEAEGAVLVYNDTAYGDLEIDVLYRAFLKHTPNCTSPTREHIAGLFRKPLVEERGIVSRQEVIAELLQNEDLREKVRKVKIACDEFLYRRVFSGHLEGGENNWREELQRLENAALLVSLAEAIVDIGEPAAERLREVSRLGHALLANEGFREAWQFIDNTYRPKSLGPAIFALRRQAEKGSPGSGAEATSFADNVLTLKEASLRVAEDRRFPSSERQALSRYYTRLDKKKSPLSRSLSFSSNRGAKPQDITRLADALVKAANTFLAPRLSPIDLGCLDRELGFYLGAVGLHAEWLRKGVPLAKPRLAGATAKTLTLTGSLNAVLVGSLDPGRVMPNDVTSDERNNLFVITGPNNGGKTTYLRQVGQLAWLAQMGLMLPAKEASLSVFDGIFTSFAGGDDRRHGMGQYLAELNRIKEFLISPTGYRATPYSLLLFDEFANGTDHEESVKRTGVVLRHLSEKGTTTFFVTHKQEIADLVDAGLLPGAVNLAAEVTSPEKPTFTHRILRNRREHSYGQLQAEQLGITERRLRDELRREIEAGKIPMDATRLLPKD
ncbi:MAG: hypothetical protein PHY31_02625 [Smithellaceae bacterium]|nr:hypothetical protein [Smithellaceae bacterium]